MRPAIENPEISLTQHPYALVIDDDTDSQLMVILSLQERIRAIGAINGLEAIKAMVVALRHDHLPAIIFTDLNMPIFSGWELLDLIDVTQPKIRNIPVVVMTGEATPPKYEHYRVLRKPIALSDLLGEVDKALKRSLNHR